MEKNEDIRIIYSSLASGITSALLAGSFIRKGNGSSGKDSNILNPSHRLRHNRKFPPCPWWNEQCDILVANRRTALNTFKLSGERKDFLEFKEREAIARIGLRNIKREKFKQFCEGLKKDLNLSYIWSKIQSFKNRFNFSETRNKYDSDRINLILSQIDCPSLGPD